MKADKSRGTLHGIPWGAKDLLATKGIRTTWGVKPYADQVFDEDADVVKRLEAAGAVLLAKLSLGELAIGDVWFNGMTWRNPVEAVGGEQRVLRGPGRGDGGGVGRVFHRDRNPWLYRQPLCHCGVTGLRPTYGTVSRHGAMSLAFTMDKIGPMCRGVEDLAMVFHAIKDANVSFDWDGSKPLSSLRVGIDAEAFAGVKARDAQAPRMALATLRELVGELKPVTLPPTDAYTGLTCITIGSESSSSFSELLTSGRIRELRQQDEGSWPNSFRVGATIPAADYLRAQRLRAELQLMMADTMKDFDAYITVPSRGRRWR